MDWQKAINTVWQGDCLEMMKSMPDKCVSLCLTDPPYGIGESAGRNKSRSVMATSKDYGDEKWDDERVGAEIISEIRRVSKNQIVFGGNYYADLLPPSSCWIVWDKENGENDFADCELAWASFPSSVRKFKWKWQGMLQEDMKNKEVREHPTQKPLPLFKWILGKYSEPGQTIFDPFMGSWTTAVAAKQLGRNFIGAELSEKYCEVGRQRLRQEVLL